MNKKTFYTILIAAIILIAMVVVGLLALNKSAHPNKQVTITTDKTKYQKGEVVKIFIKNNSLAIKKIYPFDYSVERFENGNWTQIKRVVCPCNVCGISNPYNTLQPLERAKFEWNQAEKWCEFDDTENPKQSSQQVLAGKYRIKSSIVDIDADGNEISKVTIYSKEFIIKEKLSKAPVTQDVWQEALAKWEQFAQEHLDRVQQREPKEERRKFIKINSSYISKYLPNYQIFSEKYFNFALRKDGHILGLDNMLPYKLPYRSAPDFEPIDISTFIKREGFTINDSNTAIEIVELTKALQSRHPVYESVPNWKMKAVKRNDIWLVTEEYIGSPEVMTMIPPYYKIKVDENNIIKEIKQPDEPCDLDENYWCEDYDFQLFQRAFGECVNRGYYIRNADNDGDDCITIYDQAQAFPETFPVKFGYVYTEHEAGQKLDEQECKMRCENKTKKSCQNLIEICRQYKQLAAREEIKECNQYLQQNPQVLQEYPCTFFVTYPLFNYQYCTYACQTLPVQK